MSSINLKQVNPDTTLSINTGVTSFLDTTDSSGSGNGSVVLSGGAGIAKKLYIGTDLSVGGNVVSGTWNGSVIGITYGGTGSSSALTGNSVMVANGGGTAIVSGASITYDGTILSLPSILSNSATASTSSTTGAVRVSGGMGVAGQVSVGGNVYLDNATSKQILYGAGGVGNPAFTARSAGTKIVLSDTLSGSTVDHAIGINTSGPWISASNATTDSINLYHAETNTTTFSASQAYIRHTTVSSSTTTGALRVDGGVGIAGALNVGGNMALNTITSGTWNGSTIGVAYGGTGATTFTANGVLVGNGTSAIAAGVDLTYSSSTLSVPKITSTDTTASTSNVLGAVLLSGGLSISNATDASSSTNGGTITTAGGVAIAKNLYVGGNFNVTGTVNIPHSSIQSSATGDDHTQYALLAGRSGGQTLIGSTVASENLVLRSTSNATKGQVYIDETTVSTSATTGALRVGGGLGVSGNVNSGGYICAGGGVANSNSVAGVYIGLSGTDAGIELNSGNATSTPFIDFTSIGVDKDGRIIYDLDTNQFSFETGGTERASLNSTSFNVANTTASTSTSTGAITVAGGVGIIGAVYTGSDLSVAGNVISGTWNASTIAVVYGGTGATSFTATRLLIGNGTGAITTDTNLTYSGSTLSVPNITSTGTTNTSGPGTGAIQVAGGVYVAQSLYVDGTTTLSNTLNMDSNKITGLAAPTADSDAATKLYVDNAIQGLDVKESVVVATTTAQTLASDFEVGDAIDGYTLVLNDRVLIKNQSNAIENGIYSVNTTGAPSRVFDLTNGASAGGAFVFVERGTTNGDTGWVCSSNPPDDVVGSDFLDFIQFSGAGSYLAGTGLTLTGNTFSVNASQTQITAVGTLTSGTWNANTITVPYGGTGATSFTATRLLIGNGTSAITTDANLVYSSSTLSLPKITSTDTTASTSNVLGAVLLSGGLSISNATDASSSTNGGTITTAGGAAIAKNLYVGGNLGLSGTLTSGTWNGSTIGVAYGGTGATTLTDNAVLLGAGTGAIEASAMSYSSSTLSLLNAHITDTTASTNTTSGALRVVGGVGIGGALNVGAGFSATFTGLHTLESSGSGGSVVVVRNTSVSGYSAIGFQDNSSVYKGYMGYSNPSATDLAGNMYLTAESGVDIVFGSGNTAYLTVGNTVGVYSERKETIDVSDTEAFLVRKDGDSGDVFTVDTTNSKVRINTVDVTPSTGDIAETSFSTANNQVSAANVTGFAFANGTVRSFRAHVSVTIIATASLYAYFDIYAIQKGSSWMLASNYLGDDTGVVFSITTGGQVQYTSTNVSGFSSGTIKFRAQTTTV